MQMKLTGLTVIAGLALFLTGCNSTTENANVNANANMAMANANVSNVNGNANANTASRRAPTREEYERNKEVYQREAKESGRKIGAGLNDGWLWVKTRFDLAATDDLRDSTINVDVDNGIATLTGTVATPEQKTKAETVAKSVEGVKSVKNMLKVSAGGETANTSKPAEKTRKPANP